MSEVCNVASRRTLTTISIWHMREEMYRAALARIIEALRREPAAAWFGKGQCSATIWMGRRRGSGMPFWRSRRDDDCRGATTNASDILLNGWFICRGATVMTML
jgi:hypothetical protein